MEKIAIIGHFGGSETSNDGQTVKTRNLYRELQHAVSEPIRIVDTYEKGKHPFKVLFKTLCVIATCKHIFLLVSGNGMRVFFPLLYMGSKLFGNNVFHDVIGGRLDYFLDRHKHYAKYLSQFTCNIVETELLAKELVKRGLSNVEVIPNFRRVEPVDDHILDRGYEQPFPFCTFSRVTKEKGIEEAIKAIEELNEEYGEMVAILAIYGPIADDYRQEFEALLANSSSAIRYRGEVPSHASVATLKDYYGVLFPTYWEGEGSAGTVAESFFAGVPVIATDWNCNKEMIRNGYNGLLYPSEQALTLVDGIKWLLAQKEQMGQLKRNCVQSSAYYRPEQHIKRLLELMATRKK